MTDLDIIHTIAELRSRLDAERAAGRSVGFVPTMGYLHDGHLSLMRASVADNDITMASIFVNPLQFAEGEDLDGYPRELERDSAMCASVGVDIVFAPSVAEMYPEPILTTVEVNEVSAPLEGEFRPTHFAGVSTVVSKLFNISGPCRAYFGEKDFQQLAIIKRMVSDLSIPVEVVGCPIIREESGLAMSSRNSYLTDAERDAAGILNRALKAGAEAIEAGERSLTAVQSLMAEMIDAEPLAERDYVGVVDAATLRQVDPLVGELRLLTATRFGKARLLDNIGVTIET